MPVRIPAARPTEVFSFGIAGVAGLAPFYVMMPGAEERLASQTTKWAPRWERNIGYFIPTTERAVQRVSPAVERNVQRAEKRVHPFIDKNMKRIETGIQRSFTRFGL